MLKIRVVKVMLRFTAAAAISLLVAFSVSAQTVRYVHTDGLGSVVLTTDKDRNIVERSEYEPYGSLLNRPVADGPGYTGHVIDAATGLTYMQQRYYDSGIGRFLSTDSVATTAKSGNDFNRYIYAYNSPYSFYDPDGRQAVEKKDALPPPEPAPTNQAIAPAIPVPPTQLPTITVRPPSPVTVAIISEFVITLGPRFIGPALFFVAPHPCAGEPCGELRGALSKIPDVPSVGPPSKWINGKRRSRLYGPDGKPKVDIDNPHLGAPYPHVHEWDEDGNREHPGREVPDLPPPDSE